MEAVNDRLKDIIIIVITTSLVILSLYTYNVNTELDTVNERYTGLKAKLDLVTVQTTRDVEVIEKEVIKIQKVYVPKKEYIVKFVKDVNETDCNASNRLLSNFEY